MSRRAAGEGGLFPGLPGTGITPQGLFAPLADARAQRIAGLQALLEHEAAWINGQVAIHVRLEDGGEAGIHADEAVPAASTIKVPVMGALYDAWESGALPRTAADERRLRLMITRSRNIVTNELIDRLGMTRINSWLAANGYQETRVRARILQAEPEGPNTVSAAEMTRMFQQIARGELVSPNASLEMRHLLLEQRWRERIPAALPPEATVGNKTGTMLGLLHDVAFVEAPDGVRYTFAVLIERQTRADVHSEAIAELSRKVYDYLTSTAPAPSPPGGVRAGESPRPPGAAVLRPVPRPIYRPPGGTAASGNDRVIPDHGSLPYLPDRPHRRLRRRAAAAVALLSSGGGAGDAARGGGPAAGSTDGSAARRI